MADPRQTKKSNQAGVAASSQKVELDRIELPPEPPAPPVADTPADDTAPEKPPAETEPAADADSAVDEKAAPAAPQTLPRAVRISLIAMAGVAAAIWVFIGAFYFFGWLFS